MSILTLPGLIDPHVHLRDPGQTHKEDFYTGTCAALAGGYTTIIDMPNNKISITTLESLNEKIKIAKEKIVCDVGFYFGSVGDNLEEFPKVLDKIFGLKLYLNETTGSLLVDEKKLLTIFSAWNDSSPRRSPLATFEVTKPILVHAEGKKIEDVINAVKKTISSLRVKVHFCHISTMSDLKQIIKAKEQGIPATCGVTPHHLFLTDRDAKTLGPFGLMKPPLATQKDQAFLWKNLQYIDIIESDHAPHTVEEKQCHSERRDAPDGASRSLGIFLNSNAVVRDPPTRPSDLVGMTNVTFQTTSTNPPYGVPGLETTLPLLLTAVSENRLTIGDLIRLSHTNPARIFNINTDPETKIEIDNRKSYIINHKSLFTKCGWSPFDGWKVKGKVRRVFIRGTKVFEDGKVLAKPSFGRIIFQNRQ